MSELMIFTGAVVFFYGLVRNTNVLNVRLAILKDDALWPAFYRALPSYDSMLFDPRFLHMWTKAQWVDYASERVIK